MLKRSERMHLWSRAFPTGFLGEARPLMKLLPALVISTMCQWYVQPIAIMFAGHLGKIQLDAVGLSCSLLNVLGVAVATGMTAACDASFAQTYGGNNKKMMGVYLQKCLFIITLGAVPCYALHLNMEAILQVLGQDVEVARLCGRYLLIHTPGTFCLFMFIVMQKYFQCQNIVFPDIWMGFIAHVFHAGLQYLLLYQLDMGVEGSAIALASYYILSLLMRIIYFRCSKKFEFTWGGWSKQCFGDWGALTKLSLYGTVLMCAEWWSFEISALLSGLLGTAELAAQAVAFNLETLVNAVGMGLSLASIIRIGQLLGSGLPRNAKTSVRVSTVFIAFLATFWFVTSMIFRSSIGKIFTREKDVLAVINSFLPIMSFVFLVNTFTQLGRAVFRVVAKQREAAIVVFVCYYIISLPIIYCLMFLTPLGVVGTWIGFLVCTTLLAVTMTTRYIWFFDWEEISRQMQGMACIKQDEEASAVLLDTDDGNHYRLLEDVTESDKQEGTSLEDDPKTAKQKGIFLEDHLVTKKDIIQKVVIIMVFVGIVLIAIVVRFGTAHIVEERRILWLSRVNETSHPEMTSQQTWSVAPSETWDMTSIGN